MLFSTRHRLQHSFLEILDLEYCLLESWKQLCHVACCVKVCGHISVKFVDKKM